jgi:hypothetical protein
MAKKARVYTGTQWVELASSNTDLSNYAHIPSTQFGFRNKIINGDFRINQRNYIKNTNLASGSYGFDRWKSTFTNTSLEFSSVPNGQIVTISSGGSIEQIIEQANITAGTYILSWVGTATGRVYNTGSTPPSYAASPITITLDGTANVEVEFTASGGTRTLHNVQLEAGSVASAFEQRPIQTELDLCYRYFQVVGSGMVGRWSTQRVAEVFVQFKTTMRTGPVPSVQSTGQFFNVGISGTGQVAFTINSSVLWPNGGQVITNLTSVDVGGSVPNTAAITTDCIGMSAEL